MDLRAAVPACERGARGGLDTAGNSIPRQALLIHIKPPGTSEGLERDEDAEWSEESLWFNYALPVEVFAAVGTGPWFSDSTTPITRTMAEILADASTNQYHILASATKGVAVYDPYTVWDSTIVKADRYFKAPLYSDVPTAFFNGMDTTGKTSYTGGPTYAPDHLGVLRSPGANLPAIEGMRLATTVEDGAVLGGELVVNGGFDVNTAGWTVIAATLSVVAGALRVTKVATNGQARSSIPTVAGSSYLLSFSLPSRTNTVVTTYCQLGSVAGLTDVVNFAIVPGLPSSSGAVAFTAKSSTTYIQLYSSSATGYEEWDNISVKEIIPTYVSTDISGAPIVASKSQRTRVNVETTALGPELCSNGDFSNGLTGWTLLNTPGVTIVNGVLTYPEIHPDYAEVKQLNNSIIGKTYSGSVNIVSKAGTDNYVYLSYGRTTIYSGSASGLAIGKLNFTVTSAHTDGFSISCRTNLAVNIDNISVKEVIPVFSSTYLPGTTFPRFDVTDPLKMPGLLCEGVRTNKVTCRKSNPIDTSGLTKSGDAAAVLSVVDDTAALTAAGLIGVCNSGKVYKFDNSLGTAFAFASMSGSVGNTNPHSISIYARKSDSIKAVLKLSIDAAEAVIPTSNTYVRVLHQNVTPGASSRPSEVAVGAGSIVYFILPQLEEGAFCTSPICKAADGSDPLTSIVRDKTTLAFPTLGKIRSNNQSLINIIVPRATGQSGVCIYSTYIDASNYTAVILDPTVITYRKRITGVNTDATVSIAHAKDVPIQWVLNASSQVGMQISARQYSGGAWSAWTVGSVVGTTAGKANAIVGTTYQPGSLNGTLQFCGNLSEIYTHDLPLGIPDYDAWVKIQLGLPV